MRFTRNWADAAAPNNGRGSGCLRLWDARLKQETSLIENFRVSESWKYLFWSEKFSEIDFGKLGKVL